MAANPWIEHVKRFRAKNPNLEYKECLKRAKKSYKATGGAKKVRKSKQKGGYLILTPGRFIPRNSYNKQIDISINYDDLIDDLEKAKTRKIYESIQKIKVDDNVNSVPTYTITDPAKDDNRSISFMMPTKNTMKEQGITKKFDLNSNSNTLYGYLDKNNKITSNSIKKVKDELEGKTDLNEAKKYLEKKGFILI